MVDIMDIDGKEVIPLASKVDLISGKDEFPLSEKERLEIRAAVEKHQYFFEQATDIDDRKGLPWVEKRLKEVFPEQTGVLVASPAVVNVFVVVALFFELLFGIMSFYLRNLAATKPSEYIQRCVLYGACSDIEATGYLTILMLFLILWDVYSNIIQASATKDEFLFHRLYANILVEYNPAVSWLQFVSNILYALMGICRQLFVILVVTAHYQGDDSCFLVFPKHGDNKRKFEDMRIRSGEGNNLAQATVLSVPFWIYILLPVGAIYVTIKGTSEMNSEKQIAAEEEWLEILKELMKPPKVEEAV